MLLALFQYFSFLSCMRDLIGSSNHRRSLLSQTIVSWGIRFCKYNLLVIIWIQRWVNTRFNNQIRLCLLSWLHHFLFCIKITMITIGKEFSCPRVSKFISRLSINAWKSSWFWLGELYRVIKSQILFQTIILKFTFWYIIVAGHLLE